MTRSYELWMLIDGVVKRFPTAIVEIDTPFYKGRAKVLCMDSPVQEVIVRNILGVLRLRQHYDSRNKNSSEDEIANVIIIMFVYWGLSYATEHIKY